MKRFGQLTQEEKQLAEEKALETLLEEVITGSVHFNDDANKDDLQARIDQGLAMASCMGTPWFAADYIMDLAGEDLKSIARPMAFDAIYPQRGEALILGVAQ